MFTRMLHKTQLDPTVYKLLLVAMVVSVGLAPGAFRLNMLLLAALCAVGVLRDPYRHEDHSQTGRTKKDQPSVGEQPFDRRVIDLLPDVVYICDLDAARMTYANQAVKSILGYTSDEIMSLGWAALMHPDDLAAQRDNRSVRENALKQGRAVEIECRMKTAAGEWRWMQIRLSVFSRKSDGTPREVIGVARDITEFRQHVLRAAAGDIPDQVQAKEYELGQLKNRLMTTISHEFRTPLSVILASGELLERYFDRLTPARRGECLTAIKTQILHLREMLNEITTILGEESRTPVFRPIPSDLQAMIGDMVDEMQASVGSAYTLTFAAEGDLNPIPADEEILRPILRNLLNNAVKYSPTGEVIQIGLTRAGDEVLLTVRDHGIGIPANEQDRIFDTLHRASNVSHIGGLGIGLRIVRDYVALHGGAITVESREGQGTTFTVSLPALLA